MVHVAIGLLAMIAFSALVVDYGIMWAARGQTQNAADMAGHAGAVAMAFDTIPEDSARTLTRVRDIAAKIAAQNKVIGQAPPSAAVVTDLTDCASTGVADCVDTKVYRNGANSSTKLPVFFGSIFGSTGGGAKARTVVRNANGTGSDCLAPFVFPDKFTNSTKDNGEATDGKWKQDATFDDYCSLWDDGAAKGKLCDKTNPDTPFQQWFTGSPGAHDAYTAPGAGGSGTGFKFVTNTSGTSDYGAEVNADDKNDVDFASPGKKPQPAANRYVGVNIGRFDADPPDPAVDSAAAALNYRNNILSCNGTKLFVGEELQYYAAAVVDTDPSVRTVFNTDPAADWVNSKVTGSCIDAGTCTTRNGLSPRVFDVAMYDPKLYEDDRLCKNPDGSPRSGCTPKITLKITNIVGFFLRPKDNHLSEIKDGKFRGRLVPMKALSCTADVVTKKKKKNAKFSCPDPNPQSFTRSLTFFR